MAIGWEIRGTGYVEEGGMWVRRRRLNPGREQPRGENGRSKRGLYSASLPRSSPRVASCYSTSHVAGHFQSLLHRMSAPECLRVQPRARPSSQLAKLPQFLLINVVSPARLIITRLRSSWSPTLTLSLPFFLSFLLSLTSNRET